jgi:ABC-type lipoprotein export system ATPase subunit
LRVKSIRISNILSFEEKEKIEDAEEIRLKDDLNILIGPNGSGKSNFLEIINQIFRNVLVYGTTFNPQNIANYDQNPGQHSLVNTIGRNNRSYNLPKNNKAKTDVKRIGIQIELSDDDIKNLVFISDNVTEFNRLLSTYCNNFEGFPTGVTETELLQRKIISFIFEDVSNRRIFEQRVETPDTAARFVLLYLRQFEYVQYLVTLANEREGKNWPPLKNTFAVISGYRNYNKIEQIFPIDPNESTRLSEVTGKMISDTLLESKNEEPIVFSYVKHKLIYAYHGIREDIAEGRRQLPPGKDALSFLSESTIFQNINSLLKEHLDLQILIEKESPNSHNYRFNFADTNTRKTVQIGELSAGQKGIIHFIFSIYGYDLERGIMIIDEPELHLHPQVQEKYLRIIDKVRDTLQIQFVIATHSAAFITARTIDGTHRFYKDNGFTRVVSPIIQHDEKDLIRILTLTNGSKIFFASKVVLVEGDSDEFFFKAYYEYYRSTNSIPDTSIEFLYIGGKGNYEKFRHFLDKFKIQTFYIGDLDNVLDAELGFITQQAKSQLCCDFDTYKAAQPAGSPQSRVKFIDYLKAARTTEWSLMVGQISRKYADNIFILKEGNLECYIDAPYSNKLENAIDFHKNRLLAWLANTTKSAMISEIDNILKTILT